MVIGGGILVGTLVIDGGILVIDGGNDVFVEFVGILGEESGKYF